MYPAGHVSFTGMYLDLMGVTVFAGQIMDPVHSTGGLLKLGQ